MMTTKPSMRSMIPGILFFLIIANTPALAATLSCNPRAEISASPWEGDAGVTKHFRADCEDRDGGLYRMTLEGAGVNLILSGDGEGNITPPPYLLELDCPFVDRVAGSYTGYEQKWALAVVGTSWGVFTGENGVCLLYGIQGLGIGYQMNLLRMKIEAVRRY